MKVGLVGTRGDGLLGQIERADAAGEQQDAGDLVVDDRLGHLAGAHRVEQRLLPGAAGSGHDDVEPAEGGADGRAGRHPVADHDAVESELALQQTVDEVVVVGHRRALDAVVDPVVGRHDRPGSGVDGVLERREVDLAHRLRVDPGDVVGAVGLGVVGDVVLDARRDALVLDAGHDAGSDDRGEQRVLGVALEVAAADGGALDVDLRREHDVDAVAASLPRERPADLDGEVDIPGRPDRARAREERGGLAFGLAEAADPDRSVGHRDRAEADPGSSCRRQTVLPVSSVTFSSSVSRPTSPWMPSPSCASTGAAVCCVTGVSSTLSGWCSERLPYGQQVDNHLVAFRVNP